MSKIIALAGFSGSGKSSSLKYLDPETTFIISCTPKQLAIPQFRKNYKKFTKNETGEWVGNWFFTNKFDSIRKIMTIVDKKMPDIKTLVLDDCNYLLTEEVMSRAFEKGFDKHVELANKYYYFILDSMKLRDDLNVLFISHIMNVGTEMEPQYKLTTFGKMLDTKANIDGLFNYIIYAEKLDNGDEEPEFKFRTRPNANDTCRSTAGCFEERYIEPNAQLVIDTINKFEGDE